MKWRLTICSWNFLLICLCSAVRVHGQQPDKLDSLLRVDERSKTEDAGRVRLWTIIAKEYQYKDTAEGFRYADKAIALANALHAMDELALAMDAKAELYHRAGQHRKALAILSDALRISNATGNEATISAIYNDFGLIYWQTSDWKTAIDYFDRSIRLGQSVHDEATLGETYGNLAIAYYEQTNYAKALDYYQKALTIEEKLGNKAAIARNLQNIGMLYSDRAQFAESLDYLLQAARINSAEKNAWALAHNYANLGWLYEQIEDYDQASDYYDRSLRLCEHTGEKFGIYYNLQSLGTVELRIKHYSAALADFRRALALADTLGNKHGIAVVHNYLGNVHAELAAWDSALTEYHKATVLLDTIGNKRDMGDNREKIAEAVLGAPDTVLRKHGIAPRRRLDTARKLLAQAMIWAKQASDKGVQASIWRTLSIADERDGKPAEALWAYKQYSDLRDSLTDNKRRKELVRKGIEYEFNRKADSLRFQHELAETTLHDNLRQQRLYGVGIFLVLCAATGFFLYRNKIKQAALNADLERQISDAKLSALLAQMNPHFIFNCLASIKQMILENEQENANAYLNKFTKMIRLSLEYSRRPYVTVGEELEYLNNYLQMELLRFDHSFHYQVEIDEELSVDELCMPPMMMQPLVENAIWHGLMNKPGNRELCLRFKLDRARLVCEIEDNGVGFMQTIKKPGRGHKSLGIENIRHRLGLVNEKYHLNCGLQISDKSEQDHRKTGTLVILTLPAINQAGFL